MKKQLFLLLLFMTIAFYKSSASVTIDTVIVVNETRHDLSVCIPSDYDESNSYPLIIGLHYCGGNSEEYRDALEPLCDSLDVIIACPHNFSQQITDSAIITLSIDTAMNLWSVDPEQVYLTGMSCNGVAVLEMGLDPVYPFRGIFAWAPWFSSFTSETFNLDSEMPVVLAVGSLDDNYRTILRFYDSLSTHGADVSLKLVPNVGHTLYFTSFADDMITCMHYLNDTNSIGLSTPQDMFLTDTDDPVEVYISVINEEGLDLGYSTTSSHRSIVRVSGAQVVDDENIKVTTTPVEDNSGIVYIVVEARDTNGTSITQSVFHVIVEDLPSGFEEQNVLKNIMVYPIPSDNEFTVSCETTNFSWQLYSLQGALLLENTVSGKKETIDCSSISSGEYLLKVIVDGRTAVQKVLIKK